MIQNDIRPIALRKQKRGSIASFPHKDRSDRDGLSYSPPTKNKKRVRSCTPGSSTSSEGSTGITPFVQNTSLHSQEAKASTRRALQRSPRCVSSLPSDKSALSVQGLSSDVSSPVVMQFAPLREALAPKTRRQQTPREMSEETNNLIPEGETLFKLKRKINELEQAEETRQPTAQIKNQNDDRTRQSKKPIRHPKSGTQRVPLMSKESSYGPGENGTDRLMGTDAHKEPNFMRVDATEDHRSTSSLNQPFSQTATTPNQIGIVESSAMILKTNVKTSTANLMQARCDLERLYPGETALPLGPPADDDCSSLLSAMLEHLRTEKSALHLTRSALRASETQVSNINEQLKGALTNLDSTREAHAQLLDGVKASAGKYAQARERIFALETDLDERNRSSEKLGTALKPSPEESKSSHSHVTCVEEEGKQTLESLRSEMSEIIMALECKVDAETSGRREAEDLIDAHVLQMKTLEGHKQDSREALSEKQALVRNLEEELVEIKRSKEDETGRLNVKVSHLEEALSGAQMESKKLEEKNASLSKALISGKEREMKNIANLKAELSKAIKAVEDVVGGWERDASRKGESIEVGGILTHRVESGRCRAVAMETVEGAVETMKGQNRRSWKSDSGICMFEEDVHGKE